MAGRALDAELDRVDRLAVDRHPALMRAPVDVQPAGAPDRPVRRRLAGGYARRREVLRGRAHGLQSTLPRGRVRFLSACSATAAAPGSHPQAGGGSVAAKYLWRWESGATPSRSAPLGGRVGRRDGAAGRGPAQARRRRAHAPRVRGRRRAVRAMGDRPRHLAHGGGPQGRAPLHRPALRAQRGCPAPRRASWRRCARCSRASASTGGSHRTRPTWSPRRDAPPTCRVC